jgi:phosphatidylinositol glycan class K
MTGRHEPGTPPSKRLGTDANSRVLLYLTGHGGDGFFKFQDSDEITAEDFADIYEQMHAQDRWVVVID